jgi:hypothetical protein
MSDTTVIKKEIYLQLRASNHRHKNKDGGATALHVTFKQINGEWTYFGLCAKLPKDLCDDCPCNYCIQAIPEGLNRNCNFCVKVPPTAPCMLDELGMDYLKTFALDGVVKIPLDSGNPFGFR